MSITRGMRTVNSVEAGLTDSAALETLLADGGRRAELAALIGMRGQVRRLADAALTSSVLAGSAKALETIFGNRIAAVEYSTNAVGIQAMRASRIAMKAATGTDFGVRGWARQFPWTSRTSSIAGAIRDVAFGNGVYVAVGANGGVSTSPDGAAWTARAGLGTNAMVSVAFGNGLFVAIGGTAAIYTSPDGINWTVRANSLGGATSPKRILFIDGQFVALWGTAADSHVVRATDPTGAWTSNLIIAARMMHDIAYGNGTYVAVGSDGSAGISGYYSTSLTVWTNGLTSIGAGNGAGACVVYSGGYFIAFNATAGSTARSLDGITWANTGVLYGNSLPPGTKVLAVAGLLFAPTNGGLRMSTDIALSWSDVPNNNTPLGSNNFTDACYAGSAIFITGAAGRLVSNY